MVVFLFVGVKIDGTVGTGFFDLNGTFADMDMKTSSIFLFLECVSWAGLYYCVLSI